MEQNIDAAVSGMNSSKQSNGKGLKIAVAATSVLAVLGVGFGVYGMMFAKNDQISDLKVQVKEKDGTVTTLEAPEVETTTDDGTTVTITDTVATTKNPEGYIYVGAWGVKIAIPDSLKSVSYAYVGDSLCVDGVKYREGGMHYFPDFADIEKNWPGLGCVSRTLKDGHSDGDAPLKAYEYKVSGPHAPYSEDKDELKWESESTQEVQKMLKDMSNFSEI